jgi:hypothetical protein
MKMGDLRTRFVSRAGLRLLGGHCDGAGFNRGLRHCFAASCHGLYVEFDGVADELFDLLSSFAGGNAARQVGYISRPIPFAPLVDNGVFDHNHSKPGLFQNAFQGLGVNVVGRMPRDGDCSPLGWMHQLAMTAADRSIVQPSFLSIFSRSRTFISPSHFSRQSESLRPGRFDFPLSAPGRQAGYERQGGVRGCVGADDR